jgi:DNA-binding transcriptional regulator YiaG
MGTVRKSIAEIRARKAIINKEMISAHTDADVDRFAREDDSETHDLGVPEFLPPRVDVKALREKLGVSRAEFGRRYFIPARTLQEWEQHRREPADAARAYLFAISQSPDLIADVLKGVPRYHS